MTDRLSLVFPLCFTDKTNSAHVFHLEVIKPSGKDKLKTFSLAEGSSMSTLQQLQQDSKDSFDYNPKKKKVELIKLINIQEIDCKAALIKVNCL